VKAAPETQLSFATLPPYLKFNEVKAILRCSDRTLSRYYRGDRKPDGTPVRPILGYIRRGRSILFAKTELERFLAARTVRIE
jgi:Helix-turn-helix domain